MHDERLTAPSGAALQGIVKHAGTRVVLSAAHGWTDTMARELTRAAAAA